MFVRNIQRLQLRNILNKTNHIFPKNTESIRPIFTWLNKIFNQIDYDRKKKYGAERVCTEWLLRNGAKVKWMGAEKFVKDYNTLPKENTKFHIVEIDASGSSISHYGFEHFIGCDYIQKLIIHDCVYIEDEAMNQLHLLKDSLTELQVSLCGNISDNGLRHLKELINLKELLLFDLHYVKEKELLVNELQAHLPKCHISFDDIYGSYFDEKVKLKKPKPQKSV